MNACRPRLSSFCDADFLGIAFEADVHASLAKKHMYAFAMIVWLDCQNER